MTQAIHNGDCLEVLRTLASDSLDSLVTDPPAGISFMGKAWDDDKGGRDHWIAWLTEVMRECYRVLKPGAHGVVWALPRTSHWTATALENAGFEIRDVVTHLFGTGFPKSLDISKAIDKAAGAERKVVGPSKRHGGGNSQIMKGDYNPPTTAPATDAARQYQGWGTALKPASEHWILIRKPLSEKTVAANVLKHGTGGINVDGCRVASTEKLARPFNEANNSVLGKYQKFGNPVEPAGRFPANLVLSHNEDCADACSEGCAVALLDEQSGITKSTGGKGHATQKATLSFGGDKVGGYTPTLRANAGGLGDTGGASRFFYCAKASKTDRNRKAKHGKQTPDGQIDIPNELFDPAGNASGRHGA